MPFYEYQCSRCAHQLEVMQKISDAPLRKCPACGKSALRRLMSAPVFRLKGSGWYETDFKSDKEGKRNLAGADKDESTKTEPASDKSPAKSEATADTKADTKAQTKTDAKAATATPAARKPAAKSTPVRRRAAKSASRGAKRGRR